MASRADELRQASFRFTGSELPRLLTLQEFCAATSMGESTVRAWIVEGKVAAVSPNGGASLRIPFGEIARVFLPVEPKTNGSRRTKKEVGTNGVSQ